MSKADNGGQALSMSSILILQPCGQTVESVSHLPSFFISTSDLRVQEEIRLAVDTFSSTLLPAHFDAISLCWNEALAKAPVEDRVRLVSFLIQLRPHFPHWKGTQIYFLTHLTS